MRVEKVSARELGQKEVEIIVKTDESLAEVLEFAEAQKLFLSMHTSRYLFDMCNEHEKLENDLFRVSFECDCAMQRIVLSFYTIHERLLSDFSYETEETFVFAKTMSYEIVSSDYNSNETDRVMHEFAAFLALKIVRELAR